MTTDYKYNSNRTKAPDQLSVYPEETLSFFVVEKGATVRIIQPATNDRRDTIDVPVDAMPLLAEKLIEIYKRATK